MSINLKPVFPLACFLAWLFFVVSCEKPAEPIDPVDPPVVVIPDTTIITGSGDTITVPIDTTIASFTFTNNNCTAVCSLSFTNNSYNATSYLWDFGDPILGEPSTSAAANPVHAYKNSGTYQVVLKAKKGNNSSTYTQTITINRPVIPYTIGGTNSEYATSMVQLSDGGYAIAGVRLDSFDYWNVYLLRTDAARNVMWERDYGSPMRDVGQAIRQTPDGGFIIAGYTTNTDDGMNDIYLVKTDAQGSLLWEKKIGGDGDQVATAMTPSNDGGFVMSGIVEQGSNQDALLVKVDMNGNLVWQKQFGSANAQEVAYCIQATPDGGYLLGGYNSIHLPDGPPGDGVSYLLKTDAEGNLLMENDNISVIWHTRYIDQTADGGFILAGSSNRYTQQGHIVLVKLDSKGAQEWLSGYNTYSIYDDVYCVRQTSDGGYITCGAARTSPDYDLPIKKSIFVIKTDADGNQVWQKTFTAGIGYGIGYDIQQTPDGGYILAGLLIAEYVEFVREDDDVYLLKLDANGNPE
jgi:PKD repeat protein